MIRDTYYGWLDGVGLARPAEPGVEPDWSKLGPERLNSDECFSTDGALPVRDSS